MKILNAKENFPDDHFYNILRLFAVLTTFPFTSSETTRDYCTYKHGTF